MTISRQLAVFDGVVLDNRLKLLHKISIKSYNKISFQTALDLQLLIVLLLRQVKTR